MIYTLDALKSPSLQTLPDSPERCPKRTPTCHESVIPAPSAERAINPSLPRRRLPLPRKERSHQTTIRSHETTFPSRQTTTRSRDPATRNRITPGSSGLTTFPSGISTIPSGKTAIASGKTARFFPANDNPGGVRAGEPEDRKPGIPRIYRDFIQEPRICREARRVLRWLHPPPFPDLSPKESVPCGADRQHYG